MNNDEQLNNLNHSAAHLLASAVMNLYPQANRTIGPAIENGFYFDFDFGKTQISEEDLPKIEAEMIKILPNWTSSIGRVVTKEEAQEIFKENKYKLELIQEFTKDGQKLTFFKSGEYEDLCKGGHVKNPSLEIGAFKLLSIAGAYWRGNEKNKMLTRIYGTAFSTKKELQEYLLMLEEAKKRDHKKLGRELDLFFFDQTSPGMTYWLPNGLIVYNILYNFAQDMYHKYRYQEVATPQLNKKELYETSGHWQHYRDDMFITPMSYLRDDSQNILEGSDVFGIKPMNCPNAMTLFAMRTRSYKELPLRIAETTMLHRFELSGTLNGLFRTRQFRQDDAHIFLQTEKLEDEFTKLLQMVNEQYKPFGLSYRFRYGTRPNNFLGKSSDWDKAEKALKTVLDTSSSEYFLAEGEGAFYGPKIDILMKDTIGREWQTGTIQLDFQQPKRFNLKYSDSDGSEKMPIVLHRAIFGSIERFLGILIEHYAGAFPTWLAPVQIQLLPIADRHIDYASQLAKSLSKEGIRAVVDERSERLQAKIRDATLQKTPYLGIIGDREQAEHTLAVRKRGGEDLGSPKFSDFLLTIRKEIAKKGIRKK